MSRQAPICWIAVALSSLPALAQSGTSPTAGVEPPARSIALEDEASALSGNPAGAAFAQGLGLEYVREGGYTGAKIASDGLFLSGVAGPLALGLAQEWLRAPSCSFVTPCPRRTTFSLAARGGPLALGVALHTFSSPENRDLDSLTAVDAGLLARPSPWLSVALLAQDLNRPQFGFSGLPRRWTAAVGLRPIGEVADVGVDVRLRECAGTGAGVPCGASHADYLVTLDARLVPGLRFVGQAGLLDAGHTPTVQAGLQIDLPHVGVRYAPRFTSNEDAGYAMRVRLSTRAWESLPVRPAHAVLVDLDRALEAPKASALDLIFPQPRKDPLARTLELLDGLARDRAVKAVVLKGAGLPIGFGKAQEIRAAIENLQAAKKKVLFYLESGGDLEYSVAAQADRVYVAPQAVLAINGFSATALYAAAGLDKLGVKAEFFRVGAYKNAPDLFTRSDMSGEQREVQNAILDDLFSRYVQHIAERRRLDATKVKSLLDKGLLGPQEAVAAGLADGLLYPDQLEAEAGRVLGARVGLSKASFEEPAARETRWAPPPAIAVVRVEGDILRGEGGADPFGAVHVAGSTAIARRIREAADDPRVAAIVVRIDSPGGDGNASDLIWRELVRARKEKKKPVVASMGDVAASGGYYVAAGADEIWAEPATITGSIGVFIGHFDAEQLYGKLGLNMVTVRRGASADLFSTARDLTDRERAMLQAWVDGFYSQFLDRVAEARHLDKAEVDRVARGRVWTGAQAFDRHLVDRLGGLSDALRAAKQRAGLAPDDEVAIRDEVSPKLGFTDLAVAHALEGLPVPEPFTRAARAVHLLGEPGTVRAALPFDLEVR